MALSHDVSFMNPFSSYNVPFLLRSNDSIDSYRYGILLNETRVNSAYTLFLSSPFLPLRFSHYNALMKRRKGGKDGRTGGGKGRDGNEGKVQIGQAGPPLESISQLLQMERGKIE